MFSFFNQTILMGCSFVSIDVGTGAPSFASLAAQVPSNGASTEMDSSGFASGSGSGSSRDVVDRKSLQNIRVVQRNLIYVIGIPPSIAVEEVKCYLLYAFLCMYVEITHTIAIPICFMFFPSIYSNFLSVADAYI
jgi:hypothetical protein